jgi:hypothetical protein
MTRFVSAGCAVIVALAVTYGAAQLVLVVFDEPSKRTIGIVTTVVFGLTAAWLFTRAADGPIRWRRR